MTQPAMVEQILGNIPKRTGDRVMGMVEQIAGGMMNRDPIGGVLRGVRGFTQSGQDRESLATALAYRADQLDRMGTPQAGEMAKLLRTDPKTAHTFITNSGGYPAVFQKLEAGAAQKRAGEARKKWLATTAPEERTDEGLYGAMLNANIPQETALAWATGREKVDPEYKPGTQVEKLQEALRHASEKDKPAIKDALLRARYGSGMDITSPDGTTISFGVPRGGKDGITPKTKATVEADIRAATGSMERMREVVSLVRPEDLTYWTKGKQWLSEQREKLGGLLPEDVRDALERYTDLQGATLQELTFMIKHISGAQVAKWELDQIKNFMPDMDDSYTVFMSGVKRVKRGSARVIARSNLIRQGTLTADYPLYAIDKIVQKKFIENSRQIMSENPGMTPEEAAPLAEQAITREFGIYYSDLGIKPPKKKD